MPDRSTLGTRHGQQLLLLIAVILLGATTASWFGWHYHEIRLSREYLATCLSAAKAGSFPSDDVLRRQTRTFSKADWRHLILEGGRGETTMEHWVEANRARLPACVGSLLPPTAAYFVRWNALNKAWLLSSDQLDVRRHLLLTELGEAGPRMQPLLCDLCLTYPRAQTPCLTSELLNDIRAATAEAAGLRSYLMNALSWPTEPRTEPAVRALLEEWTHSQDPTVSEAATRTLALRSNPVPVHAPR